MKILAVADAEDRALSDHFDRERYRDVDLVISCGDLKSGYLDYLVSQMNVPCLYVRGNHDAEYAQSPPPGCDNLDGRLIKFGGLRFAGLEGSRWYGGKGVEYGDFQMKMKALWLRPKILVAGGVDILVTHSPPSFPPGQESYATDHVHQGFDALRELVLRHRPKLLLHGHTHLDYGRAKRERKLGETRIVDCYGACVVTV